MAKASAQITLTYVIEIVATYRYYLLQSSTAAKPSVPTPNPPANLWSDSEPTYTSGSTNSLYHVDLTVFSDDSFSYSPVSLDSAYEAAKEAYNKAHAVETWKTTTAETWMTKTDEAIALRATKDEVTEALSGYYTIEEADANVQISADSVLTSVGRTYATKEALAETDAKVDSAMLTPTIEGNGTPVVKVTNAFANSIDNLTLYGKTTQDSYSGKNFYADGDISVYGTKHNMVLSAPIPAGTYTVSVEFENDSTSYTSGLIFFGYADGTNFNVSFEKGGRSSIAVTFVDTVTKLSFYAAKNSTASVGVTASYTRIQIELGTTATEYEPYVGGVPSPNPDYPQSLNSIGEDGSIDYRVCGKNLIPYPYFDTTKTYNGLTYTDNGNGAITVKGTAEGSSNFYFSKNSITAFLVDGETYTFSIAGAEQKGFLSIVNESGTRKWFKTPYTITWNSVYYENAPSFYVQFENGENVDTVIYPQIELGTTATEYEPYVSSTPYDNAVSIPHVFTLDLASIAGEDYTNTLNGVTVKIENGYAVFSGEYTSSEWANVLYIRDLPLNQYVIPAGTYASNVSLQLRPIGSYDGGNYSKTFTITEPMWLYGFYYAFGSPQTVSLSVPLTVTDIPSGLHGIPVSSDGNRTDANGQHWVCDEIDLKRGVYIQRIGTWQVPSNANWNHQEARDDELTSLFGLYEDTPGSVGITSRASLCDKFIVTPSGSNPQGQSRKECVGFHPNKDYSNWFYIRINKNRLSSIDVDTFKTWLADNPIAVLYQLDEPIETPLDAETLASFASITNEPGTVIAIAESDIDVELSEIASNRAVETTAADIRETITEQNTSILSTCESIVLSATESVVKTDEFNTYKETTKAEMELMSDNIGFKFSETSDRIDATNESLNDEINERNKHIKFDQNGITIQAGENSLKLHLDNDMIYFEKNGIEFGFWDGVDFHTGNIIVDLEERAQFGNFAYISGKDGSLSFLKVADTAGFYVRLLNGILRMYGTNSTLEDATLNISDVSGTLTETTLILGGV